MGAHTETEIKRQLEHSAISNKLRIYSFRNHTPTLTEVTVYAKTLEDNNAQAVTVERRNVSVGARNCSFSVRIQLFRYTPNPVGDHLIVVGGPYPHHVLLLIS